MVSRRNSVRPLANATFTPPPWVLDSRAHLALSFPGSMSHVRLVYRPGIASSHLVEVKSGPLMLIGVRSSGAAAQRNTGPHVRSASRGEMNSGSSKVHITLHPFQPITV